MDALTLSKLTIICAYTHIRIQEKNALFENERRRNQGIEEKERLKMCSLSRMHFIIVHHFNVGLRQS